jgi:hypothetical protein
MLTFERLRQKALIFKGFTGITVAEFEELLAKAPRSGPNGKGNAWIGRTDFASPGNANIGRGSYHVNKEEQSG